MEGGSVKPEATLEALGGHKLSKANGVKLKGWSIFTERGTILNGSETSRWENELCVFRLPEMVFGKNELKLEHESSGVNLTFNAWDALHGWVKENLPPVKVPAASKWMEKNQPMTDVVLDYDYTFTTGYIGSEGLRSKETTDKLLWEESEAGIDWQMLKERDPIFFYDDVLLYEDELADCGVAICSVKVRVMPKCWFVLLRFWLRVDGVLVRLRDTRLFSKLREDPNERPVVVRERCQQVFTFEELSKMGFSVDVPTSLDPNAVAQLSGGQRFVEELIIAKS